MSWISPKPVIGKVVQRWRVTPGMSFSLIEDVEQRMWIVESCPAGTQFWTVDQAAQLANGSVTQAALGQAVRLGRRLERMHGFASSSLGNRTAGKSKAEERELVSA